MDRKTLAACIKTFGNIRDACDDGISELEKLMSEDGGERKGKDDEPRGSRSERSRSKARGSDDEDEPTKDEIIKAAQDALKVLDSAAIKKILKKHGKADRASEVEPEHRQAAIDALEEAVKDAD